jgi:hypothetical protein
MRLRTREWAEIDCDAELGVRAGAPRGQIDEAYRRRAKELHPDRNPEPGAVARFQRVAAAYATLRDPTTRAAYDDYRRRLLGAGPAEPPLPRFAPSTAPLRWGPAPMPPRRPRAPMPDWLRTTFAVALVVAGIAAAAWTLVGARARTAGDTPVAVQITLAIVAAKLVVCGLIVLWYPRLRARWMPHRPA